MTTDFRAGRPLRFRARRPLAARPRGHVVTGIAAVGLLAATLAPALAASPAAAAPCDTKEFLAAAQADLLKATVLDLRPLGADAAPLVDVTVSSATSAVKSTTRMKSAATARYLDARVLGEKASAGPLDAAASQYAPPSHQRPETVTPTQLDASLLRVGTGHLMARAKWKKGYGCRTASGVIAESYGSDLDAAVLPQMTTKGAAEAPRAPGAHALGDALVALPSNASSRSSTALTRHLGAMATQSTASISLTQLVLFGGTDHQTTVRVVSPPELRGTATGSKQTSSVTYDAPILEVTGPDGATHRIDSPDQMFELTLPPSAPPTVTERRTEKGSPKAPGLPDAGAPTPEAPDTAVPPSESPAPDHSRGELDRLLDGLDDKRPGPSSSPRPGSSTESRSSTESGSDSSAESDSSAGGQGAGGPATTPSIDSAPTLTLRLSLGHLESAISRTSVHGEAASLRLQLLASRPQASAASGPGAERSKQATIADLGLGLLEVRATAPAAGGSYGPPAASEPPTSGGGSGLPVTGFNLLAVLATGALLLVVGGFLTVVARRRLLAPPEG